MKEEDMSREQWARYAYETTMAEIRRALQEAQDEREGLSSQHYSDDSETGTAWTVH